MTDGDDGWPTTDPLRFLGHRPSVIPECKPPKHRKSDDHKRQPRSRAMAARRKTSAGSRPFELTLLIFGVIGFLYFTGEVLKPLALSVLLSFALAPAVRLLERIGLPRAGAVILTVVITLGFLG